jgi:phage terminase small subunit
MSRHTENLEPREEAFAVAFACIESETYGHGTNSAIAAGYAENSARTQAWKLRKRPEVQARIAELYELNLEKHAGKILSDLEHHRKLALAKNDIASANKATELQGKAIGMFYERSAPQESFEQKQLTEQQRKDQDEYNAWKTRQLLRPTDTEEDSKATG